MSRNCKEHLAYGKIYNQYERKNIPNVILCFHFLNILVNNFVEKKDGYFFSK